LELATITAIYVKEIADKCRVIGPTLARSCPYIDGA